MIGYKLTLEQKNEIHGKKLSNSVFFSCDQDVNGDWFLLLSSEDKKALTKDHVYLLSLPTGEYIRPEPSYDFKRKTNESE